jgi:hypothetical protein
MLKFTRTRPVGLQYCHAGKFKNRSFAKKHPTHFRSDNPCPAMDLGSAQQAAFSFGSFIFYRNHKREKNIRKFWAQSGAPKRPIRDY